MTMGSMQTAMGANAFQIFLDLVNTFVNLTLIGLQLRFTGTPCSDATSQP